MNILDPQKYIFELDGFLNALRCVIGHSAKLFGATFIEKQGRDLSTIIEDSATAIRASGTLTAKKIVDFQYIQQILNTHIYEKLPKIDNKHIKNLDWNLIEYYGLIATAEDEHGAWNRLVGQENYILEYIDENNIQSAIFFVEHNNFVVATYL